MNTLKCLPQVIPLDVNFLLFLLESLGVVDLLSDLLVQTGTETINLTSGSPDRFLFLSALCSRVVLAVAVVRDKVVPKSLTLRLEMLASNISFEIFFQGLAY